MLKHVNEVTLQNVCFVRGERKWEKRKKFSPPLYPRQFVRVFRPAENVCVCDFELYRVKISPKGKNKSQNIMFILAYWALLGYFWVRSLWGLFRTNVCENKFIMKLKWKRLSKMKPLQFNISFCCIVFRTESWRLQILHFHPLFPQHCKLSPSTALYKSF